MAADTPHQPTLPPEGLWTTAELAFKDDEPPGLFPENQDSNFGLVRKTVAARTQDGINQQLTIYQELFVEQATLFLDEWETLVGLPAKPTKTTQQRRAEILNRLRQEVFTRTRVALTLDVLVGEALAGEPITLPPSGHELVGAGSPLYAEPIAPAQVYRVYEDVRNFKYYVDIISSVTPDLVSLQRELTRITPAGITFVVDNTVSNIYHYERTVLNDSPVGYWKLGTDYTDFSGYARNGTVVGAPALVAAPGLLSGSIRGSSAARDFNGSSDAVTVPHNDHFLGSVAPITVEVWMRPDALPTVNGTYQDVIGKVTNAWVLRLGKSAAGNTMDMIAHNGTTYQSASALLAGWANGQAHHVVGRYVAQTAIDVFIDGVKAGTLALSDTNPAIPAGSTGILEIARWAGGNYFNGVLTNVAVYNYALSDARILEHYKAGKNLA